MTSNQPSPIEAAPWTGLAPRRWQTEALASIETALAAGSRAPLVHACAGAGKSLLIAEFAARTEGTVLVTTPTQALVEQLAATIEARCPGQVGRAFQYAWETDRRIVVTCLPSLAAVLDERPAWACWNADEAHRMEGDVLREVREKLDRSIAVGFTATPYRGDDRGLIAWESLVYSYTSTRAVEDGALVPWRVVRWEGQGEPDTDALVEQWASEAEGPGIISATSIDDAEGFADRIGALAIHGHLSPDEQRRRLEMLRTGEVRCLVHVQLLTEGIDLPWLCWVALRRPTSSPVRLVQEVGRVLRAHPGKTEAVIYDPHDVMGSIGLFHDASLEDIQRGPPEAPPKPQIPWLEGLEAAGLPEPVAVDRVAGWVCDFLANLRGDGIVPPPTLGRIVWRQSRATDVQRERLKVLARAIRHLPDMRYRNALHGLMVHPLLRAGAAHDLALVLMALGKRPKLALRVPEGSL